MPRKVRISASKEESRQAQQRSRARHREYVAGLERRIAEYEQRGVTASVQMQSAARAVAWKNERLLALLALRGVPQSEIDAFLTTPAGRSEQPPPLSQQQKKPQCVPMAASVPSTGGSLSCRERSEEMALTSMVATERPPVQARQATTDSCSSPTDGKEVSSEGDQGCCSKGRVCGPYPGLSIASVTTVSSGEGPAGRSPSEVTSCETAASIIVNLRGTGDVAEARQALGCTGNVPCSVKNTHLFQLMNEMP